MLKLVLTILFVSILIGSTLLSTNDALSISYSFAYMADGNIQAWTNPKDNITIQFNYFPEKPVIDTFTSLNFSVQDLKTGEHIRDFIARVVVTNGQRLFKFENISVSDGDFGVKYIFPDDGTHQVILAINSGHLVELASFQVFVPHQSPPGLLDNGYNIVIAIVLVAAIGGIIIWAIRKK